VRVINFGVANSNNDWFLWAAGKRILEEEGSKRLTSSSTMLAGWFCEQKLLLTPVALAQ